MVPPEKYGISDDPSDNFVQSDNTEARNDPLVTKTSWFKSKLLWLVLGGAGAAVTGTYVAKPLPPSTFDAHMADTGLTFSRRSVDLRTVQSDALRRREVFAEKYRETRDMADVEQVALETEWINYLRSTTEPAVSYEQFRDTVYEPYMAEVAASFAALRAKADPAHEDITGRFTDLKDAVQGNFKEGAAYERSHNSLVDPLTNGDVQCRSGTKLFLLAILRHDTELLLNGERLVQIHLKGHTLPGILTVDGQLYGFEMTKKGKGIIEFGTFAAINASGMELEVIDAQHNMAEDAIGEKPHVDESVLLDTVTPASRVGSSFVEGMRSNTDQHGFGTVEVPAGRQPFDHADYISPRAMEGESGIYGSMGVPSANIDLLTNLTAPEQVIVRRYMQHVNYFSGCFNRHVDILTQIQDRPTMERQEAQEILDNADSIGVEMRRYMEKNSIVKAHLEATQIMDSHGLMLSSDIRSILQQMRSNQDLAAEIWARAQAKKRSGR